jgi:superfamily I DNA and/or RNA helicase
MYAAQCRRVERLLADSDWLGENRRLIKVDTVDGYQGKENRIVIVSLVRNNKFQDQGFLHAKYRANVAMSRAMDRLIIVGAAKMWRRKNKAAPLGRVLSYIEQNDAMQSVCLASAKDVLSMEISV